MQNTVDTGVPLQPASELKLEKCNAIFENSVANDKIPLQNQPSCNAIEQNATLLEKIPFLDMRPSEWQDFYADIAMRGIKVPLEILADGTVVDGRHRLRAAIELGMKEVPVMDAPLGSDTPEVYMLKAAILRRHLTDDQRACIAALWIEENKKTPPPGPGRGHKARKTTTPTGGSSFSQHKKNVPTKTKATQDFKVSRKKIDKAEKVKKKRSDLFDKVHKGNLELKKAYHEVKKEESRTTNDEEVEIKLGSDILTGDMSLLWEKIEDNSVDLIFTDPPYSKETLPLFGEVAKIAKAKLKSTGFCLVYTPHEHLPHIINIMQEYLNFWWIFAVHQKGAEARIWKRHIWVKWKPLLVFTKASNETITPLQWVMDAIDGEGEDKKYHDWGQNVAEATYWIEKMTPPGGLVVDPLCGGGTIPLAAKITGRRWFATENDPHTAALARHRLEEATIAIT
jgi:hypothetical protein